MSEFDTIGSTATASGVPKTLADELKAADDTDFHGGSGPSYDEFGNDINLPTSMDTRSATWC